MGSQWRAFPAVLSTGSFAGHAPPCRAYGAQASRKARQFHQKVGGRQVGGVERFVSWLAAGVGSVPLLQPAPTPLPAFKKDHGAASSCHDFVAESGPKWHRTASPTRAGKKFWVSLQGAPRLGWPRIRTIAGRAFCYCNQVLESPAVHCPFCSHPETKVIDSRLAGEGTQIRRRRECLGLRRALHHLRGRRARDAARGEAGRQP